MPSEPTVDNSAQIFANREMLTGHELAGREILVCWDDGVWYDAVVVRYYPLTDEYKMVYRADDGIEVAKLRDRRWILAPQKRSRNNRPVLDGAMIEFEYPSDGHRYRAMVYDYSHRGERLKIAYIEEHTTDNLKGGGWDFITTSPCLDESLIDIPRPRTRARTPVPTQIDEDEDVKDEPLPVNVADAMVEASATRSTPAGTSKKRKKSKISKGVRRSRSASASRSSPRVNSKVRR